MIDSCPQETDIMITARPILPTILALTLSAYSMADDLTDASEALCDTIKTCALEAVAGQDLSDQLQQQMDSVLEGNCADMRSRVQAVSANDQIYQPAVGCLRSMASLSCPHMQNASQFKTPECAEYDRLLKAASTAQP